MSFVWGREEVQGSARTWWASCVESNYAVGSTPGGKSNEKFSFHVLFHLISSPSALISLSFFFWLYLLSVSTSLFFYHDLPHLSTFTSVSLHLYTHECMHTNRLKCVQSNIQTDNQTFMQRCVQTHTDSDIQTYMESCCHVSLCFWRGGDENDKTGKRGRQKKKRQHECRNRCVYLGDSAQMYRCRW